MSACAALSDGFTSEPGNDPLRNTAMAWRGNDKIRTGMKKPAVLNPQVFMCRRRDLNPHAFEGNGF